MSRRMIRVVPALILMSFNALVFAQDDAGLREVLHSGPAVQDKAAAALAIANRYMHSQNDSALHYAAMGLDLSTRSDLDTMRVRSHTLMAKIYALEGRFEASLGHIRQAGAIAAERGHDGYRGQYLNLSGRYFKYLQQYDSALYYTLAYDAWLAARNSEAQRFLPHLTLADLYYNLGDQEKADLHLRQSLAYARIEKEPKDYLYVLSVAMDQYEMQGRLKDASDIQEEYLQFKMLQEGDASGFEDIPQHSHFDRPGESFAESEAKLLKYIPVHNANRNWISLSQACYRLGNLYVENGFPEKAIPVFSRGLEAADSLQMPGVLFNMHSGLYQAYAMTSEHALALKHHEARYALRESIRDMERQEMLGDMEVRYETHEKELALAEAQLALSLAQNRQRLLIFGAIALCLILGVLVFAFIQKQKLNRKLAGQNEIITNALKEKDILLREIHHRVKNNLQMISALLYLHGRSVGEGSAQQALLESQNRVQSMAMIHQNLYQDDNLLGVAVKDYLDKLLDHLTASYNIEKDRIHIRSQVQVDHLDVDTIVPLALIINELISNSLKYAFTDGRKGLIEVSVAQEKGRIAVKVSDNGTGLPHDFSMDADGHFGYKLIRILAERMGARISTSTDDGTSVSLYIPVKKAA